jgi:hypothetical protein
MKNPLGITQNQPEAHEKKGASPERTEAYTPEGLGYKSSRAIRCFFPERVYSHLERIKEERGYPNSAAVVLRACERFIKAQKQGRRI